MGYRKTNRSKGHLDELIYQKEYELDCLKALRDIFDSGDCNTCANKSSCEFRPEYGKLARYNCYNYKKREAELVIKK